MSNAMERQLRLLLIRLPPRVRPSVGSYEPVIRRVLKNIQEILPVIQEQRREAGSLVDRLLREHLPAKRPAAIIRSKKLHSVAVAQECIQRSLHVVFSDAPHAIELGRLAATVATQILSTAPGAGDLCGLAYAVAGNGCRVLRHYDQAASFFDTAYSYLGQEGMGDLNAQAQVFSLHASLLKDQGDYQEGLTVLHQAVRLFKAEGDESRLARCLIQRGCILQMAKDLPGATQAYMDTLHFLDDYEEPWLVFVAAVNLASIYCDLEDFEAAASVLKTISEGTLAGIVEARGASPQLQLTWTNARIAAGRRKRALALRLLAQVEKGFTSLADPVNTALVALERARLLHQGFKHGEVRGIVERVHRVLQQHQFPGELREMAAMPVEAAQQERPLLQNLEAAISQLKKHRARRPC